MPPHPHYWATPCPHCWATPCHCHWATTHPDLWHLLGWRLTRMIIVSFCLHLNRQKMERVTQVKLNLPIMFFFCDWAMGTMSEGVYNNPHQERCVGRKLGGSLSKMLHNAHEGCEVKVHRFCLIDWLHQHYLEVNHDDTFFCRQHNECY